MKIEDLGFDEWFRERCGSMDVPGIQPCRVINVQKNCYVISNGDTDVLAEITGKLSYGTASVLELPTVGDWVQAQLLNDETMAIIHAILPRKSLLARKTPGRKTDYQLIAANIDTALVMQGLDADFNINRLERYLVMATEGKIDPVVLLSKSDLIGETELEKKRQAVSDAMPRIPVIAFSNESEDGLDAVMELLSPGRTYYQPPADSFEERVTGGRHAGNERAWQYMGGDRPGRDIRRDRRRSRELPFQRLQTHERGRMRCIGGLR
jgi:ribosome biogenesis GTPase